MEHVLIVSKELDSYDIDTVMHLLYLLMRDDLLRVDPRAYEDYNHLYIQVSTWSNEISSLLCLFKFNWMRCEKFTHTREAVEYMVEKSIRAIDISHRIK